MAMFFPDRSISQFLWAGELRPLLSSGHCEYTCTHRDRHGCAISKSKKTPFAIRADRRTGPVMSEITSVRNSNLAHENVIWNEAVVVDRWE
jgi:hypothetical protein